MPMSREPGAMLALAPNFFLNLFFYITDRRSSRNHSGYWSSRGFEPEDLGSKITDPQFVLLLARANIKNLA